MSNQELLEKLKEDMEMRGFSHYTKDSYYRKTKDIIKYFNKPMEEVTERIFNEILEREKKSVNEVVTTTIQ